MLVLFLLGNYIRTLDHHDAVIYPLPVITSKARETIHAEPEKAVISICKSLLSLEFCMYLIASGKQLEGFEFRYRDKAHVRASG